MDVSLSFVRDFSGGVFTEKGIGDERCRWRGRGDRSMVVHIPLSNGSECGLRANESGGEYNLKLIISPVDGILVDGFTAMSVRCVYSTEDITLTLPPGPNGARALQIKWRGRGDRSMVVHIPLSNGSECGLRANESGGEYNLKLIISPVDGILVDGFTAMSVRCVYSTQDITLTLPPGPNGARALQIK
ncbi:unnamed protein product [Cylicostephanus goldi]|uniref:ZP domain-containing protein n=1 Tax=Cylicostephanus goldi TaxID=71465 RepID=A0A3P7QHN1_CYLGO|nr:unnamed protein product [Cylicostephanus goldi]